MTRLAAFSLAAFSLAACNTAGSIELKDTFDPTLADGHTADEHTEVAPGVYLLSTLVAAGTVKYVDLSPEEIADRAEAASRGFGYEYCYNYESASYADELTGGTMFMDNPSWYGSTYAYSYDYDTLGTEYDQDYEQVSAYLWSYSRYRISSVYATAYVYINGDYAGYVNDAQLNATTALAYVTFDAECVDGSLSVEMRTYHSWSSNVLPHQQYLYLSNTSSATVECCPARE